jgi:hypothetical protein
MMELGSSRRKHTHTLEQIRKPCRLLNNEIEVAAHIEHGAFFVELGPVHSVIGFVNTALFYFANNRGAHHMAPGKKGRG